MYMSSCEHVCTCMCACVHVCEFVHLCILNVCAHMNSFMSLLLHYCACTVWLDLHQNPHYAFSYAIPISHLGHL